MIGFLIILYFPPQKAQEDREQALETLLDTERQLMLWQRKIALEKEMKEALDPAIGQVPHSISTCRVS